MHKIKIKTVEEKTVKYLTAMCGVRYWEDATVNDVEDSEGQLIPCRKGDTWSPVIDIEDGRILDWPESTTAKIHYKVCDNGEYKLLDLGMNTLISMEGYVPSILSPKENGYGDYVIMDIDENGKIDDWKVDLSCFEEAE